MANELTELLEKADALSRILDLRAAQEDGELPPAGNITQEQMAQAFGMSRSAYQRFESTTLLKAAHLLGDPEEIYALLSQH